MHISPVGCPPINEFYAKSVLENTTTCFDITATIFQNAIFIHHSHYIVSIRFTEFWPNCFTTRAFFDLFFNVLFGEYNEEMLIDIHSIELWITRNEIQSFVQLFWHFDAVQIDQLRLKLNRYLFSLVLK